ncbi:zinc finger protein 831 [Mixophyes fleayi]|uniref:zinc finger protein 831 n=1 Tax=Mixophyes fleayi TaxID=3061075 RepID=UPI003F4E37CB
MEASNVSVLSSSLAWPTCTSMVLPSSHNNKPSTANDTKSPAAVVLKGVSVPLYQITQQEGQQTPFQLTSNGTNFAIDNANLSVMFTPQPQTILQKSPTKTLTLNIMNTLPILYPSSSTSLIGVSPGKAKNIGKHICIHCGRDCLKPSVLEKHIRSHTGERPFPCTICGISFKTQSNLYKHRRTQTHVNNTKQSCHSDYGSCQEDPHNGRVGDNPCFGDVHIDKDHYIEIKELDSVISAQENGNLEFLGNKEAVLRPLSIKNHEKALDDPDHSSLGIVSPDLLNQQRTLRDEMSTTTSRHARQRHYETGVDKQWAFSSSERKLKKCESTDSGYLSHSDSADLQMVSGSPLQSLSESSIECEHMLSTGTGDSEGKPASSKKNLREHISMLISQNKAVVEDTHLDNVRPRKTALSKQGSIDLPMPYTFKDSFHFDIKSLDVNRKKVSLCSAKSIFTLPEKNKPLCFHSVPTQISTTLDSAIFARSNSLPFVDSSRVTDRLSKHNTKTHCLENQALKGNYTNLLLSNTATACIVDFSRNHPRGLVRQAAVDEMQTSNVLECSISQEIKEKKQPTVDPLPSKSKTTNKKGGQKKLNMFSHEKWQMYGDETFKKFYQKMKKNEHAGKTEQAVPDSRGVDNQNSVLQTSHGLPKASESLATLPQVTTSTSRKVEMTSKEIGAHIPTRNVQNDLGLTQENRTILSSESLNDSGSQACKLETKLSSDSSSAHVDCPQHLLACLQLPGSDNGAITVTEKQNKLSSVSNIPYFQNSEKMLTDNRVKVAKMKVGSTTDNAQHTNSDKPSQTINILNEKTSLELSEDTDMLQYKNVDFIRDIDNTARELLDGVSTILGPHSLSTVLNKNFLPSLGNDCEKTTALFSKQLPLLLTQASTALKENVFSPRYLIKCHYIGAPIEASPVMQADQVAIRGMSTGETDSKTVIKDANSEPVFLSQAETDHQNSLANQVKLTQIHRSEIALFGNISINTECVPTCASKISIDLEQKVIVDTHETSEQKVILDDICPEKQCKIQEHTSVQTASNTLDYKDSIVSELHCRDYINQQKTKSNTLVQGIHRLMSSELNSEEKAYLKYDTTSGCSEHMSTSVISRCTQNPRLLLSDTFHTGPPSLNPIDPIIFPEQKNFLCSTTHLCLQSGICNVRVTKVAFSALNTEPKSTWCWLDRCLPFPAEQKEKSFSVYASLTCNTIKDRRRNPSPFSQVRSIEKDWPDRTTSAEQNLTSSLLLRSTTHKECLEKIKEADVGKFQPLAKKSSKMGAMTTSRQVKRSKDRAHGSPHSKVSQHMNKRGLRQDQKHNKISCPSYPQSGEIFLRTDTFEFKDKGDSKITTKTRTLQSGDKREKRECKAGLEMNEGTASTASSLVSDDIDQLATTNENKHSSQPAEEKAHQEVSQVKPLNWQKSGCNVLAGNLLTGNENTFDLVTSEIKRVHLQQDLRDSPPQKHGRKILHRSKTIGHSLSDETAATNHNMTLHSSISFLPCAQLLPRTPVELSDGACIPSLQNTMELPGGVCRHSECNLNTISSGAPLEPGALSLSRNSLSRNHGDLSSLQHQSLRSQKKLNLEVMRKQTHVEHSDTSSDDEDRLYIEI